MLTRTFLLLIPKCCVFILIRVSLINDSILAPTFYIFFASALPVIAFGEQLNRDTGKTISFMFSTPSNL